MVYYISRDYQSQNTTTTNRRYIASYLMTIFLRRILGYSYVGDTNYPINSVGSLLIATGDSTPTSTPTFAPGDRANISNTGATVEVHIPVGIRTVSAGDVGRILVLKSPRYPTRNSGIFLITAINAGQNRYVIDYRSADAPPPETDTIDWYLYERDLNCPGNGAGNGSGGYNSIGASVTPRIILQSPHTLGWQIRICNESTGDSPVNIFNAACAPITAAPGFGGNSSGDYTLGSEVLHSNIFYNLSGSPSNADYVVGNGFGDDTGGVGAQHRYTFIGDDTGVSVHMVARRLLNAIGPRSIYVVFGLPENEPAPLPIKDIRRLYVLASARGDVGNGQVNDVSLAASYTNSVGIQGCAFHESPISAFPSALAYVTSNNQLAGPAFDASAGDSPFTSATELMPVDITAGMVYSYAGGTPSTALPLIPKCLGTIPFMRYGRANFGNYTLTTDNATWTVNGATNASPIQITTSTNHSLVTGQSVAIHSVGGNTAANGTFIVTVTGANTFTLNGSTGNGSYTSGGTVLRGAQWQHMRNGIYFPWNGPAVVA